MIKGATRHCPLICARRSWTPLSLASTCSGGRWRAEPGGAVATISNGPASMPPSDTALSLRPPGHQGACTGSGDTLLNVIVFACISTLIRLRLGGEYAR